MIPQKDIALINEIGMYLKCTTKLRFIGTRIKKHEDTLRFMERIKAKCLSMLLMLNKIHKSHFNE